VQARISSRQKKTSVPMSVPGRGQITCPQRPPPLPPLPALVDNIDGSSNVLLELAISSSGLHGGHRCITASLSSLVVVDAMCINSHITSNIFFSSSFNDVDPSHMILVD
jgi:hypothetical protein